MTNGPLEPLEHEPDQDVDERYPDDAVGQSATESDDDAERPDSATDQGERPPE